MKSLSLMIAAVAIAAAANLSPASAGESPAPGATAWPAAQAADGEVSGIANRALHYEWQYHYGGRHARYEGHWVLVR